MNKKSLFVVLFAMLCLAVFTVSVSADQDGHTNWCNMDQYGCWVTGDGGEQVYIMFWSEEARTYFMGPNSNAVVTDFCADCEGGKLSLPNNGKVQEKLFCNKYGTCWTLKSLQGEIAACTKSGYINCRWDDERGIVADGKKTGN